MFVVIAISLSHFWCIDIIALSQLLESLMNYLLCYKELKCITNKHTVLKNMKLFPLVRFYIVSSASLDQILLQNNYEIACGDIITLLVFLFKV